MPEQTSPFCQNTPLKKHFTLTGLRYYEQKLIRDICQHTGLLRSGSVIPLPANASSLCGYAVRNGQRTLYAAGASGQNAVFDDEPGSCHILPVIYTCSLIPLIFECLFHIFSEPLIIRAVPCPLAEHVKLAFCILYIRMAGSGSLGDQLQAFRSHIGSQVQKLV